MEWLGRRERRRSAIGVADAAYDVVMKQIDVQYAKAHLSTLIAAVERGEEFAIMRGDHPVARLIPTEPAQSRELGFVNLSVPDDFLKAMPEAELAGWEDNA